MNAKALMQTDNIDDFILAIAGGADVNEKIDDEPLVQYCFEEFVRCTYYHPEREVALQKLEILISSGANLECLFSIVKAELLPISLLYELALLFEGLILVFQNESCPRICKKNMNIQKALQDFLDVLEELKSAIKQNLNTQNGELL